MPGVVVVGAAATEAMLARLTKVRVTVEALVRLIATSTTLSVGLNVALVWLSVIQGSFHALREYRGDTFLRTISEQLQEVGGNILRIPRALEDNRRSRQMVAGCHDNNIHRLNQNLGELKVSASNLTRSTGCGYVFHRESLSLTRSNLNIREGNLLAVTGDAQVNLLVINTITLGSGSGNL